MKFIPLQNINFETARTQFKFKRGVISYIGMALVGVGVVTLPLPTGSPFLIMFGLMLTSPVKLKYQVRNKKEDLKLFVNKKMIMCGLK